MQDDADAAREYYSHVADVLRRRFLLIVIIVGLVTSAAIFAVSRMSPRYAAEAQLVIDGPRQRISNVSNQVEQVAPDTFTNETEAAVLRSSNLIGRVVEKLFPSAGEAERIRMINEFTRDLRVSTSEKSRVLSLRFPSGNAEFSARFVNQLLDLYLLQFQEQRDASANQAMRILEQRVEETRVRLAELQRRSEEARARVGMIEFGGGGSVFERQLVELNQQHLLAQYKRVEAETNYQQYQRAAGSGIEAATGVVNSQMIGELRKIEAEAVRRLGEMRRQYRDGHPRLQIAQTELGDLRRKIGQETHHIMGAAENEMRIARAREAQVFDQLQKLQKQLASRASAEVEIRVLDSEVKTVRQLYDTLLTRLQDVTVSMSGGQAANAQVISRATVPTEPFAPRKGLIIVGGFIGALIMGIGLAFLREALDGRVRRLNWLIRQTGATELGAVQRLSGKILARRQPWVTMLDQPQGGYAESVRAVMLGLHVQKSGDGMGTAVVVASAEMEEGRSNLAISVAIAAARSGLKTLLIDGDPRRPMLAKMLRLQAGPGLLDVLSGRTDLGGAVQKAPPGFDFLPAGGDAAQRSSAVPPGAVPGFLDGARRRYDLVLIDTAPIQLRPDAIMFAHATDQVMYVVAYGQSRRARAVAAIERLSAVTDGEIGLVMTKADLSAAASQLQARTGSDGIDDEAPRFMFR